MPSSGVFDVDLREPQVAQRLEADQHRGLAQAAAELAGRRVAVAQHAEAAGDERVVDDGHSGGHARARYSLGAVSGPRRNVELKAVDPDPAHTLSLALALGASDEGVIVQRDTYFRVASGRLKLREEEPGEAHLIAYSRPDDPAVRVRPTGCCPRPTDARRAERDARRRRRGREAAAPAAVGDGADPPRRGDGPGSFIELEAVAEPHSDLAASTPKRALRAELGIGETAARRLLLRRRPGPRCSPTPSSCGWRAKRRARAYAPYSNFPVGAAVRTEDGRRYAGANVENAAYPQGQCAEASAIGAMVAGGGGRVVEVVVAAPSAEECAPCGGCRQRLREFAGSDAPIHLADLERVRRTTSLAELLPLSFGPESLG